MLGDRHDFSNIETRAVIKFFFLFGKAPKKIYAILTEILGESTPLYAALENWVASLNVVIFPPVLRLVLDDSKQ
jgi:hypothetical protein